MFWSAALSSLNSTTRLVFKIWTSHCQFFFSSQLAHLTVLTGFRMLPRKDLVRAKTYFLIDAACAAVAYSLHQADYFYFILILQQWQHIFYYSTWDKSAAAKVTPGTIKVVIKCFIDLESDLLVKSWLESWKMEPGGLGVGNCFWPCSPSCKHVIEMKFAFYIISSIHLLILLDWSEIENVFSFFEDISWAQWWPFLLNWWQYSLQLFYMKPSFIRTSKNPWT